MDEEEYQKYCVGRREGDARDDIDSFCHPDRMRRLFLAHLHETCLQFGVAKHTDGMDLFGEVFFWVDFVRMVTQFRIYKDIRSLTLAHTNTHNLTY